MKKIPLFAGLFLAACTTIPAGGVAVPGSEIRSMMSGQTWLWNDGAAGAGIYFGPDGSAVIRHEGQNFDTTWSTRDGAFCYAGTSEDRCWALYRKDGKLYGFSMWQSEYREPWEWSYTAQNIRPGKRI